MAPLFYEMDGALLEAAIASERRLRRSTSNQIESQSLNGIVKNFPHHMASAIAQASLEVAAS